MLPSDGFRVTYTARGYDGHKSVVRFPLNPDRHMIRRIKRILFALWPMLLLAGLILFGPSTPPDTIRHDGLGYHLWTYAIVRGDMNFAPYKDLDNNSISEADPQRGYYH